MMTNPDYTDPEDFPVDMRLPEYLEILREIEEQAPWRTNADKEMDYVDGNQLDSELLQKQAAVGIPPAVEDLMGPAIRALTGYEASTRTDWKVSPDGGPSGQDVADALGYQLKQAEKASRADHACGEAFRPMAAVGIGWVEVGRQSDPFMYPYRCGTVHRNEIHWDMQGNAEDPLLEKSRWLRRSRWLRPERIIAAFPKHKDVIRMCGRHGSQWWGDSTVMQALDGGASTGLQNAWNEARGWTIEESRWFDQTRRELCLVELWYRRWEQVPVLTSPDGRVVEFDENNQAHLYAVTTGVSKVTLATVARLRMSYWLGPHRLHDGPSPYSHRYFPYVPFVAFREDRTGVPYGYARSMIYQQDSVNSGTAKLRWGMSVVRTERTKGAVAMSDAQFRQQIARPDADIVLDAEHMARQGAVFKVHRDFQLNDQQFQMLQDARLAIERVSVITSGFQGKSGTATSGVQEMTQVEQTNQSLGTLMTNFRAARTRVGEILMALIIEDWGTKQRTVTIEGQDGVTEDRVIELNKPEIDPATGLPYLSNDLTRTMLKVGVEEVPSSTTYRQQQLKSLGETVKALPPNYQAAVMPFMVALMDVPFKRAVVEAIRAAGQQETPEAVEQRIQEAVEQALMKAGHDLKSRELDMKERVSEAQIKQIMAQAVQTGVQAAFSAMQAGSQVAQMPQIAPVADAIMQGAGYVRPERSDDPNFPTAGVPPLPPGVAPEVNTNTSPAFPPVPDDGASPMAGIETASPTDNLQGEAA
jgi:hypothetical protein